MAPTGRAFRFSIDRGGTFTDVFAETPTGPRVLKLLSVDPANYPDAPTEGIRRVLAEAHGEEKYPRGKPIDTSAISDIRMGTTVATNALLERKGERCALLTTKGFADLLHIGNQARPNIFELAVQKPELLYEEVIELDERVVIAPEEEADDPGAPEAIKGTTGERIRVETKLDEAATLEALTQLRGRGIASIAVVLMHSYTFPDHEKKVGELAAKAGFDQISLSSALMPMVKAVPRGYTAVVDAYLTPVLRRYIDGFCKGFDAGLRKDVNVSFMRSDGGLADVNAFTGHSSILSGPAGGVVGYARTAGDLKAASGLAPQTIGFDMGGTSTDVSRFAGAFEHVFETTTAGVTIQSPQLDINTVAAGGGSRLFFRRGLLDVGPDSAGAHPGPVCYRKPGGLLAVTDANAALGRVLPKYFPKIFGPNEDQPLDAEGSKKALQALTEEVNAAAKARGGAQKSVDEVAYGFLRVANEAMARPIRNLTVSRGYDATAHVLATFGGAGPQHCCAIARALGMRKIAVHKYSGILSAYGLSLAEVVAEKQAAMAVALSLGGLPKEVAERLAALEKDACSELAAQGFPAERISAERFLNLRFQGTDTALMTTAGDDGDYLKAFLTNYRREFGFELKGRSVIVDDARVRAVGKSAHGAASRDGGTPAALPPPQPLETTKVYFEGGWRDSGVFRAGDLKPGHAVEGPAIVMQDVATVVVEPGCTAKVTADGNLEIDVPAGGGEKATVDLDPIWLSLFAHRFMGIAEQMGRRLQRTSISVNIKERLDFSCAIFDSEGGLVANAPHLPVHLGSMQEAVKFQVRYWAEKGGLQNGDVLVSNHPLVAGGSHLPDITVITPVFASPGDAKPSFFTASRGHHADVGGKVPGSMPPFSSSIHDEGAQIVAFKLVSGGVFQEEGIRALLEAPAKIPGCSGARCPADNLSDLKAQVAANTRGNELLRELCEEHGIDVVKAYMRHIQANAESAVRSMLLDFSARKGLPEVGSVCSEDFLDDGTRIALKVTIDRSKGSAVFDFEGTDKEILGNLNAPPAVTYSAVIYCMRCLLADHDIPLNQGCLAPIEIRIPKGTLLNPSSEAAVVGGNVETSQRVTDVIFKAFGACAASQGTMNNFLFGDAKFGYYETICGGVGATRDSHGASGVHTHMTNTRITDPEILERRYPITLRRFGLRPGSGGAGRRRGGDGVVRELEFRRPLDVSLLAERRAHQPYGLEGGMPGARGDAILRRVSDGRQCRIGGKRVLSVMRGDSITILTPGGGGFGAPGEGEPEPKRPHKQAAVMRGSVNQFRLDQEQA